MDPYAAAAAQTYPPSSSQIQPQNQDPYLYSQQYEQSQPYPYYPQIPQQYPNPNPNPNPNPVYPEQEPAPIHPPGVPVQSDPTHMAAYQHGGYNTTAHFQNDPYYPQQQQQQLSYSDPGLVHQQQWQQHGQAADYGLSSLYPPNGQPQNSGSGRGGGRGFRGGGSSFRGRGPGRGGRGGKTTTGQPKPACMAWCELCRVDCNTLEILENHKNGKKHKKNLKVQEDLQKLAAAKSQETQVAAAAAAAAAAAPERPENLGLTKVESQAVEPREQVGGGSKRKVRAGERKSAEPSKKPKEIIPFICELCDVKCESAPTFDSHLKGKKHAFNLQRFQEQQASLGQAALQALYPALEALYPALLQALANQTNANASTSAANGGLDQQVLQWLQAYLPQTGPAVLPQGPESAPVPALEGQGPNQEAKAVEGVNQVEPAVKTEDQVEPAVKIEEKVEGVVKNEEKVEAVEAKVEEQLESESKGAETKQ